MTAQATQAGRVLLEARALTRRFGGLVAVDGFDFRLHEGEVLGLIGPNGAGKSTTFNVITGFYRPSSGEVIFDGRRIDGLAPARISRMGMVRTFQHGSLLADLSVYDNLVVASTASVRGRHARHERAMETAGFMGLADVLHERAGSLPHGRQRMVGVGIALATRPRLLCLDEPLTGLDTVEVNAALALIRQIRESRGVSVLFVEHNMKAVMSLCDRIVVLDAGRKLAEGTPQQVSADPRVIKAYLGDES